MSNLTFDPAPKPRTNGWAVAALVLGILTAALTVFDRLVFAIPFLAIAAVACGADGIRRSKKNGTGFGLALTGLILGGLPLLWLGFLLFGYISR